VDVGKQVKDMNGQADLITQALGVFIGFVAGIGGKIIYDKLAEPQLQMAEATSRPFLLERCELDPSVLKQAEGPTLRANVLAYRVKVTNKQKWLLNAPARNCIAWLDLEGAPESYQLCWVGSKESVTINVGDSREIDVCGLPQRWGVIVAPIESGYNFPRPRTIGGAGIAVQGWLRVTSENAKFARSRIVINVDENHTALRISLSNLSS